MKENSNPLVSIIIPVYNGANYMREAIDSAINQSYKNIEIIVINDGSTDDGRTDEIAKSYGNRIRYYNKENGGVSTALNLGIQEMHGEYFSWLSHDDKYAYNKIERQIKLLKEFGYSKSVVALCEADHINKDSKIISVKNKKRKLKENRINTYKNVITSLLEDGTFNGCALLIPRDLFYSGCEFDEKLRFSQDFYLWMKMFLKNKDLVYSPEKLVYNRVHNQQCTQTKRNLYESDSVYIANQLFNEIVAESDQENNLYYLMAKHYAVHSIIQIPKIYIKKNKETKRLSNMDILKLKIYMIYGKIRPKLRKLYYSIVLKVKTDVK